MPYLNVDVDYFDHPKTKRLVGLLGRGSEVLPIKLWSYCGKFHAKDGRLTDYSPQEIESIVGWWGKSGEMVPALVKVGFISETESGLEIHEWKKHEGHICAFKVRAGKANKARWDKIKGASNKDATRNPKPVRKESPKPTLPTKPLLEPPPTGVAVEAAFVQADGAVEVPTEEQAVTMTMSAGIAPEFVRYAYRTWASQSGKNANGIIVNFLPWVTGRWKNEQVEWKAGTHRGNRQKGTNANHRTNNPDRNAGTYNKPTGKYENHVNDRTF